MMNYCENIILLRNNEIDKIIQHIRICHRHGITKQNLK